MTDPSGLAVGSCTRCAQALTVRQAGVADRRLECPRCGAEYLVALATQPGLAGAGDEPAFEVSCQPMTRPAVVEASERDALVLRLVYAHLPWFALLGLLLATVLGLAAVVQMSTQGPSFARVIVACIAVLAARRLVRHFMVDRRLSDGNAARRGQGGVMARHYRCVEVL
ncbi:MAG: hypothetical protein IPH07_32610 [Deltaproteobacteria bacterium]|nr:hypothetical protein [Deltaproteobacteria bacterium]MBK8719754.1 hypothetical protein [Deltaproteobacteria bacterium]MBP7285270.1 hypothetical protein [Nannocystaceae bacterium]